MRYSCLFASAVGPAREGDHAPQLGHGREDHLRLCHPHEQGESAPCEREFAPCERESAPCERESAPCE
eukprot:475667-Prorocentrum_minimum.AAC.2